MKVESSQVSMTGVSQTVKEQVRKESLTFWTGSEAVGSQGGLLTPDVIKGDILDLSPQALEILSNSPDQVEFEVELSEADKQKILVLQKLLSALTGKKIKFIIPKKLILDCDSNLNRQNNQPTGSSTSSRLGWGLVYSLSERYQETEKASFLAAGIIKTSDGKVINFEVGLNMSRQFVIENNLNLRLGDARLTDPLVINYSGTAAELTTDKFNFDLDLDGRAETISFVTPGSGFLALDLNDDGVVNDGGELFGPTTGEGFAELAGYDTDGNRWIDENDPVYGRLRIWTKDEQGKDYLMALGQVGVGAIYLGNVELPFSFKDKDDQLLGMNRSAGVFIRENLTAGTVQQLDLVI